MRHLYTNHPPKSDPRQPASNKRNGIKELLQKMAPQPATSPHAPDGLYAVRSGVATAVTAEDMAIADYTPFLWQSLTPQAKASRVADYETVIAALTQAQGGAE